MLTERSFTRLTLALDIIGKINDGPCAGYHELGIIKHQISLFDTISMDHSSHMQIDCNDPAVPADARNICWKMVDAVKQEFQITENVHITIEKNIPVQGGLAGGSANAATVLHMLSSLWDLHMSTAQQRTLARSVGMDVPFYGVGGTAFDTETTGVLEPIDTRLSFDFVLVVPEFGVATREAYQNIAYDSVGQDIHRTTRMRQALVDNERSTVIALLHNDFEKSVFVTFPRLAHIQSELVHAGCLRAIMSGSGSTLIGLAEDHDHAKWLAQKLPFRCLVVSTHVPGSK